MAMPLHVWHKTVGVSGLTYVKPKILAVSHFNGTKRLFYMNLEKLLLLAFADNGAMGPKDPMVHWITVLE